MRTDSDTDSPAAPTPTPRDLILCCDGTNNTLSAGRADTHVLRLYQRLRLQHGGPAASSRVLFYAPGVGAPAGAPATGPVDYLARTRERIAGLASGNGIYANIADAYLFIVRHHRTAEDRIWLFGFSRGAFTARCVAGMINLFGIIGREHEVLLPTLIRVYFSLPEDRSSDRGRPTRSLMRRLDAALHADQPGRAPLARQIREDFTRPPGRDAWVHFVGVWDTVESVGLPGPLARSNPSSATFADKRFHHVRHALALDEHRWAFEPRLYEEPGDVADPVGPRTLKQRWFPGVHRDVGGGFTGRHIGLADATLRWMVEEANACGLGLPPLEPAPADARATAHDELWQTPAWALAGMSLRDLQPTTALGVPIEVIAGPPPVGGADAMASVWSRRRGVVPLVVAILLAAVCLLRVGGCLMGDDGSVLLRPDAWGGAVAAAADLALAQLRGPFSSDTPGLLQRHAAAPVFWAMVWDFGFIACWGFLLARIASRSFAWLAGLRRPGMGLPLWRWLGFMPLGVVAADGTSNLATIAAFVVRGAGIGGWASDLMLLVCSLASLLAIAGAIGCLPLVLVRLWLAIPGVSRVPRLQAGR